MAATVRMRTILRMMTPFWLEYIQVSDRRSPDCDGGFGGFALRSNGGWNR